MSYRVIMGQRVPLALVPRFVEALAARYPEATAGLTDPDAIGQAATRAFMVETLIDHEEAAARAPLATAVAQTVSQYEQAANAAKAQAQADVTAIVNDVP